MKQSRFGQGMIGSDRSPFACLKLFHVVGRNAGLWRRGLRFRRGIKVFDHAGLNFVIQGNFTAAKKGATETAAHKEVEELLARKNVIIQLAQSGHYRRLVLVRLHFVKHGVAEKLQTMPYGMLDEAMKVNWRGHGSEV